jgi:2C-methyl-D-erythritol 2,4-cyclodiphosphate synthase
MANILSKKTNDLTPKIEQQISQVFTKFKDVQLINYNIQKIKNNEFIVKLVVATNRPDLDKIKKNIEKEISNNLKIKLSFIWIVVPKYQVPVKKKNSKEKEIYSRLSYKWEAFLNQIFTN